MEIRIINQRLATKGDHKQKEPFILETLTPERPLTQLSLRDSHLDGNLDVL